VKSPSNQEERPYEYRRESALVEDFIGHLAVTSPWGSVKVMIEFFYARGRTDVVALGDGGELIAFEAKLSRWRDALHQAYRNRCFAHRTYVVLPQAAAETAVQHEAEFRRRGVGLVVVSSQGVREALDAEWSAPWQEWLSQIAASKILGETDVA
jgi:hypothetical protein